MEFGLLEVLSRLMASIFGCRGSHYRSNPRPSSVGPCQESAQSLIQQICSRIVGTFEHVSQFNPIMAHLSINWAIFRNLGHILVHF